MGCEVNPKPREHEPRPPAPGASGRKMAAYWEEITQTLVAERREMLILLGWTPPESDDHDEFWFREDHGPVHIDDLWPFALQDVQQLKELANHLLMHCTIF